MRAEALNALVVSEDKDFCRRINDCLRWVGADTVARVSSGRAAEQVLLKKRFAYALVVVQIVEDSAYDIQFIETMLRGRDLALRFVPVVAIATVRTKGFYTELESLGFGALVLTPIRRALLRKVFFDLFRQLQGAYRSPDLGLLTKALYAGDVDYVEERCARALQHNPNNPTYLIFLGEILSLKGQWKDALEQAEKILKVCEVHPHYGPMVLRDTHRLRAKVFDKLDRIEEAFSVLPQVIAPHGEQERPTVRGMVPVLNKYARRLKEEAKFEEAHIYYELALKEPDSSEHAHRLHLNIALAHFASGKYAAARDAALTSLEEAAGNFPKAERFLQMLEDEYAEGVQAGPAAGQTETTDTVQEVSGASAGEDVVARESVDISDLEAELTEEVDFPEPEDPIPGAPEEREAVFSAMQGLGSEAGLEEDSLEGFSGEGEAPLGDALDDIGEDLDLEMDMSSDDLDFDVSAEDVAASQATFSQQQEELAAELEAEQQARLEELEAESGLDAALDDVIDGAETLSAEEEPSLVETSEGGGAELPEEGLDESAGVSDSLVEAALDGASAPDLADADTDESMLEGLAAPADANVDALQMLEGGPAVPEPEPSDVLEALEGGQEELSADESELPQEEVSETQEDEPQLGDLVAESLEGVPDVDEEGEPDDPKSGKAATRENAGSLKWENKSYEERLAYIMFDAEEPRIKVKESKVRPVNTRDLLSEDEAS